MTETKIEEDIFDLSNKTLLITGACGTLGKSYCKEFAKRGATLCITDICDSSLNPLLSEIESISNRSHFAQVCLPICQVIIKLPKKDPAHSGVRSK